jgi:hypothetical protein
MRLEERIRIDDWLKLVKEHKEQPTVEVLPANTLIEVNGKLYRLTRSVSAEVLHESA